VTYLAEITVDNSQMLLRPGMTATAIVTVLSVKNGLLVPNLALRFLPSASTEAEGSFFSRMLPGPPERKKENDAPATLNNPRVWVVRDGKPAAIPVVPGSSNGKFTEIKSGAVTAGMPLIVETLKVTK
jgi:HlyD family secretion protein